MSTSTWLFKWKIVCEGGPFAIMATQSIHTLWWCMMSFNLCNRCGLSSLCQMVQSVTGILIKNIHSIAVYPIQSLSDPHPHCLRWGSDSFSIKTVGMPWMYKCQLCKGSIGERSRRIVCMAFVPEVRQYSVYLLNMECESLLMKTTISSQALSKKTGIHDPIV